MKGSERGKLYAAEYETGAKKTERRRPSRSGSAKTSSSPTNRERYRLTAHSLDFGSSSEDEDETKGLEMALKSADAVLREKKGVHSMFIPPTPASSLHRGKSPEKHHNTEDGDVTR
jgi:hypothetical protein